MLIPMNKRAPQSVRSIKPFFIIVVLVIIISSQLCFLATHNININKFFGNNKVYIFLADPMGL